MGEGGESSPPRSVRLTPDGHYTGGLVGPKGRSGRVRKILTTLEFDPRTVHLAESLYRLGYRGTLVNGKGSEISRPILTYSLESLFPTTRNTKIR